MMRVGILGTADIAKKNVRAIHLSQYTTCVAIAGRDAMFQAFVFRCKRITRKRRDA